MTVFKCFSFFNELDLLELSLMETEDFVDVWVITELPITFSGKPKPLHLAQAIKGNRFDRWFNRIRYQSPGGFPVNGHPDIDYYQRRYGRNGLRDADEGDWIILGDLDEIPNKESFLEAVNAGHAMVETMVNYNYKVNLKDPVPWHGNLFLPVLYGGYVPDDFQQMRDRRSFFPATKSVGWHLSWMSKTVDDIVAKLDAVDATKDSIMYGSDGMVEPPHEADAVNDILVAPLEELGFPSGVSGDLFGRKHRLKTKIDIVPGQTHPRRILEWIQGPGKEYVL